MTTDQKQTPLDIAIDLKQSEVRIKWQDGHTSVYALDFLRKNCPCALCEEERKKAEATPMYVMSPDLANALGELDPSRPAEKVGQYALQFFWTDGHRSGIYTYAYLRQLG
ncbi:MAG TPA: DUF971 domain-containing protein [Chloroflexi bacterium]|nr:DUF971 domain-containing protein [Chloroflexota bacterium]